MDEIIFYYIREFQFVILKRKRIINFIPYVYITLSEVETLLNQTDPLIKKLCENIYNKLGFKFFVKTVNIQERKFFKTKIVLVYFLYVYTSDFSAECISNELRQDYTLHSYYTYDELFVFLQGVLLATRLKKND